MNEPLRIGELAESTGLTVRTLHHYDAIGLLEPSERTASGYRLYAANDVHRLSRIALLRRLGHSLDEVGQVLDGDDDAVEQLLRQRLAELDRSIEQLHDRRRLLSATLDHGRSEPRAADDLLTTLEVVSTMSITVKQRIGLLVYEDIEAAQRYLVDIFGLTPGPLETVDGEVVHGEVEAGDGVIWLHHASEEFGLASPRTVGVCTASTAVIVDDVDAHFQSVQTAGADIVYEPVDQPYGFREYSVRGPETELWSFMTPLG